MPNVPSKDCRPRTGDEVMVQFVESLADLRGHASHVIKLVGKRIGKAFPELDDGTGELPRRVLLLMNNIEESFRTIRLKLSE